MAIATRLKWYLDSHGIEYEVIHHSRTQTSLATARSAQIPSGRMAKCVLLEDERGYVLAILPASCHLSMKAIDEVIHRPLELAGEAELTDIFSDCELGAVPATGAPYNVPMLVDDSLLRLPDVYFEGGDHEDLIHVGREAFRELTRGSRHGAIARVN